MIVNAALTTGVDIGAKVNALVTACGGASCSIYIPAGMYNFKTPIVLASNIELYGAGKQHTILNYTALTPTVGGSTTIAYITTAITAGSSTTKVTIHDLQVNGTREIIGSPSSYNNTTAINLAGTYSVINRVKVGHFWAYGSPIGIGGSHNTLSNSDIEFGTFCVALTGEYQTVTKNFISNHYSSASAAEAPKVHYWDGIVAEGLSYSLIEGNTVEDNGQSGIYEGGNNSVSSHNTITGNLVRHNWNRGIDNGVTGNVTSANGLSVLTITHNHVIDNLEDNIWLVCVQGATVQGNQTEYTPNYPAFFGSHATSTRSGIVVTDTCGIAPQDISNNVIVMENTVADYQGTSVIGLNLAIKTKSIGHKFTGNSSNSRFYVGPSVTLTKNTIQK